MYARIRPWRLTEVQGSLHNLEEAMRKTGGAYGSHKGIAWLRESDNGDLGYHCILVSSIDSGLQSRSDVH